MIILCFVAAICVYKAISFAAAQLTQLLAGLLLLSRHFGNDIAKQSLVLNCDSVSETTTQTNRTNEYRIFDNAISVNLLFSNEMFRLYNLIFFVCGSSSQINHKAKSLNKY